MQVVDDAVARIRRLPHARIGCNYGQGREALLRHVDDLHKGLGIAFPTSAENTINDWIAVSETQMDILKQLSLPHQLPAEYLYFLEYYDGLDIAQESDGVPFFSIFGFFPPSLYAVSRDELVTFYGHPYWTDSLSHSDVVAHNFPSPGEELRYLYIGIWFDYHQPTDEELRRVPINPETGERYTPFDEGYPEFRLPAVLFYLDFAGTMQRDAIFASTDGNNKRMQKITDSFAEWLDRVAAVGADFSHVAAGTGI
jgi:hypothetical protein